MTWYCPRKHLSRSPYNTSSKGPSLWNSLIYYFRNFLLCWLFLSILPFKPCSHSISRRALTTNRHYSPKSPRSTSTKYLCITRIRSYNHLSPSQLNRKQSKTNNPSPINYNSIRCLLHPTTNFRVLWSTFYYLRRHLWLNILCCHWLSRTSCYYRVYIPYSLPCSPIIISLYIKPPLWLWSRCLILTLCRCCMTLSLYFHLLMRFLFF